MKRSFATLHARAYCHATEDLEKVRLAMLNIVGDVVLAVSRTEGVHGNPISVVEATVDEAEGIASFFARLDVHDIEELQRTLDSRLDDGCNLFIRLDKQEAFMGRARMARGDDDVISVRIKVMAFPARCEVAKGIVSDFLTGART